MKAKYVTFERVSGHISGVGRLTDGDLEGGWNGEGQSPFLAKETR